MKEIKMKLVNTLISKEDKSVNFIYDNWLEARFVRREAEYFIVYLSSHDGCNKACRFCHLTQTGQTSFNGTTMEEYLMQAEEVLAYYDSIKDNQGAAKRVNFNFMARGEALANDVILNNAKELFSKLEDLAKERGLIARFNISTIMPMEVESKDLAEVFKDVTQDYAIYYSLYSVNEKFRKRWLPKALNYQIALKKLEALQEEKGIEIAFHWAFIEGQNDSKEDLAQLKNVLSQYNIKAKYNLVRYNPYSPNQGQEPTENVLQHNFDELNAFFNSPASRIVPRVGFDVKASCGMFVS